MTTLHHMAPQTFTEPTDLLTVREAAELLNCNPETVRRAIRAGRLAAIRPTGAKLIRIRRGDLQASA